MTQRRTQIVATINTKTITKQMLSEMIDAGMNVARFNMSWGTHDEYVHTLALVRALAHEKQLSIPCIFDLSGPRATHDGGHHFDNTLNAITEKDYADAQLALEHGIEYLALSYVGSAHDVITLCDYLTARGGTQKIIAKIERAQAIEAYDAILTAADAIMIARGDLGNDVPLENIPFIQKDLVARANKAQKPVIVATEMMEYMIDHNRPARSDVTDVAFAVLTGADAVMLSNETAVGEHPVEAIAMMSRIIGEAERHNPRTNDPDF